MERPKAEFNTKRNQMVVKRWDEEVQKLRLRLSVTQGRAETS